MKLLDKFGRLKYWIAPQAVLFIILIPIIFGLSDILSLPEFKRVDLVLQWCVVLAAMQIVGFMVFTVFTWILQSDSSEILDRVKNIENKLMELKK